MEVIKFNGNEYPLVIVNLPFGKSKISSIELNEALMNSDGGYISDEARLIDEKIFYFVEDEVLCFRENEIITKILSEI